MKTIKAIDIKYETDKQKVDLPAEIEFEVEDDFDADSELADLISDKTGWLVESCDFVVLCGNCGREAVDSESGINRCERCKDL